MFQYRRTPYLGAIYGAVIGYVVMWLVESPDRPLTFAQEAIFYDLSCLPGLGLAMLAGRVPRSEHLLGAEGGALVAPEGQRPPAHDRDARGRRDGGHRAGQSESQGRAAQGLRPARARQAAPRRVDVDLVATIGLGDKESRSKDILGLYEYFLSQFASAEGKKGGQFYTPRCVVRTLVEMLAPYKGRVCDPCCG